MEGFLAFLVFLAIVWSALNPEKFNKIMASFDDSELNNAENPNSPKLDSRVEITWLPDPRNHQGAENCYIGSTGRVDKVYEDGSFDLDMEGGILMVGPKYKFQYIN